MQKLWPGQAQFRHFIIWHSSVTLTFNLPEQMFQIAFLLLKKNNCAKLFWHPHTNAEILARTSWIWTILSFDLRMWPWPAAYPNKCFTWHFYSSRKQLCQIILKSMHKCRRYGPDKINLYHFIIWPSCVTLTFNLQNVSNSTSKLKGEKLCHLKQTCKNVEVWPGQAQFLIIYHLTSKGDLDFRPE